MDSISNVFTYAWMAPRQTTKNQKSENIKNYLPILAFAVVGAVRQETGLDGLAPFCVGTWRGVMVSVAP